MVDSYQRTCNFPRKKKIARKAPNLLRVAVPAGRSAAGRSADRMERATMKCRRRLATGPFRSHQVVRSYFGCGTWRGRSLRQARSAQPRERPMRQEAGGLHLSVWLGRPDTLDTITCLSYATATLPRTQRQTDRNRRTLTDTTRGHTAAAESRERDPLLVQVVE